MGLLTDEDYEILSDKGVEFEEDQGHRFLVFSNFLLPFGLYTVEECTVLVVIPKNYPDAGIDCLWFKPYLSRSDGQAIPKASNLGMGENHKYNGEEFCRWSRHWNGGNTWKKGESNINTVLHWVQWALQNPDADK